jgi:hypothetical protein
MTDCSELKEQYEKAKEKADKLQEKWDRVQREYEDASDDAQFEADRDCELHIVTVTLPDGTPASGPDTEGQAACLKEKERAREHAQQKANRNEGRRSDAALEYNDAKGEADIALRQWCLCEAKKRHYGGDPEGGGEPEGGSEGQFGDWNEVKWDEYATA